MDRSQMDHVELQRLFAETLEDRRLSRSERRALKAVLADLDPTPEDRLALLGRAFDTARNSLARERDREVLSWLEALAKTLFPSDVPRSGEACFSPHGDCAERLRALFDDARSSAEVCVFTITDNSIVRAILLAHERGVSVRIISDDEKALDRGSDIYRLAGEGIPVRTDESPDHMHHKFAIFDRRLVVTGSYNWTVSAAERNCENIAMTGDRRLVRAFGAEFERLWEAFAPARNPP